MTDRFISTGMGSLISNRDPHRRKLSACTARRRRLEPLFISTVAPRFLQVLGNFTLESPSYRLNDFQFEYESPDGLLLISNADTLTGAMIEDPDHLDDPAIPVELIEQIEGSFYHSIHANGIALDATFL